MALKKNNTEEIKMKVNKSLVTSQKQKEEKKVGRKTISGDVELKADKRNTFLLNAEQQEKLEQRMQELGIRNKTDYIFKLLKQDIKDL
ncbi:hypothetical protein N5U17_10075 [Aliarcobacter butzleri]|uniref:hypothetical protein n=1 Tax=Aliarcobacter butzleri TaxID=28197 RepID=UPI0021B4A4A5|nr:hypothetical protein [Aliarcobacter butzleri]MCT7604581.1 hypothetical protein [Aliarcobacter butzleri]